MRSATKLRPNLAKIALCLGGAADVAAHTIHTAWNASDGETVIGVANLLPIGKPFATFFDDMGAPVP